MDEGQVDRGGFRNVDGNDDGYDTNHGERDLEAAAVIGEVDGGGSRADSETLMVAMMVTTPTTERGTWKWQQ